MNPKSYNYLTDLPPEFSRNVDHFQAILTRYGLEIRPWVPWTNGEGFGMGVRSPLGERVTRFLIRLAVFQHNLYGHPLRLVQRKMTEWHPSCHPRIRRFGWLELQFKHPDQLWK